MTKARKSVFPKLAGNSDMDLHAYRRPAFDEGAPVLQVTHSLSVPDNRARLAMACIEKWGLVCAESNGEDSAGRQKTRRMSAAEIATLACDCAEAAYSEFATRGWLIKSPSMDEMIDAVKDQENAND